MGKTERVNTYAAQRRNRRILDASDVCHVCGEPGADAVDHVRPVSPRGPANPWQPQDPDAPYNLKPIHHDQPNSEGVRCNRTKANREPDTRLTSSREW